MATRSFLSARHPSSILRAAEVLRKGGLVAFPTETVYGLGADAFNSRAVCRIFEVKKRPRFDPLIVHVSSPEEAGCLWCGFPRVAEKLIKKFWPGPLTLVLPKTKKVPDVVTAGLSTVAVRMPHHPTAIQLIKALGHPIAAPSANLFGRLSPTSARSVLEDLGSGAALILDGGPTRIGIESTVVKLEDGRCVLLRPGAVPLEAIRMIVPVQSESGPGRRSVESPGQLRSHYAPLTPLALMDAPYSQWVRQLEGFHERHVRNKIPWPRTGFLLFRKKAHSHLVKATRVLSPKGDLYEAASGLFQAMRELDKMGLDWIAAEPVPERGIGLAIMDRLRKASGGVGVRDGFKDAAS